MSIDLDRHVSTEQFAEQVHTDFTLRAGDAAVTAELVECTVHPGLPTQEQFSLVFRVAPELPAVQQAWDVEHPVLGGQHLLLVPISRDASGLYLEAAFNRLINAAGEEA